MFLIILLFAKIERTLKVILPYLFKSLHQVRYCNATCQKLHWPAHKNFCKQLREQYEEQQRIEKLEKEEEERAKLLKEEQKLPQTDENTEEQADGNIVESDDKVTENVKQLNLDDSCDSVST